MRDTDPENGPGENTTSKPPGFATPLFTALFVFVLPASSFGVC